MYKIVEFQEFIFGIIIIMYLTYLQENFKPVAHRSASVEVFDEEDAQVVHPHFWDRPKNRSRTADEITF